MKCADCHRDAVIRVIVNGNASAVCETHRIAIVRRIENVVQVLGHGGPKLQDLMGTKEKKMLTDFEKSLLEVVSHLQGLLKKSIVAQETATKHAIERTEERDKAREERDDYIKANDSLMDQLKVKQGEVAVLQKQLEEKKPKRAKK